MAARSAKEFLTHDTSEASPLTAESVAGAGDRVQAGCGDG
jgi:hypothetical protein